MSVVRRKRGMGGIALAFYIGMLFVIGMLAVIALLAGWWQFSLLTVVLGAAFAFTGPFVLGGGWRPPAPTRTRRPVVRRRRS